MSKRRTQPPQVGAQTLRRKLAGWRIVTGDGRKPVCETDGRADRPRHVTRPLQRSDRLGQFEPLFGVCGDIVTADLRRDLVVTEEARDREVGHEYLVRHFIDRVGHDSESTSQAESLVTNTLGGGPLAGQGSPIPVVKAEGPWSPRSRTEEIFRGLVAPIGH